MLKNTISLLLLLSISFATHAQEAPHAIPVRISSTSEGHQLLRNDVPYRIQGVGGSGSLSLLANRGGNSLRTWGADDHLKTTLDDAHKRGLTVCVGIWLGHERHGFDYNNAEQVRRQAAEVRKVIETYKDHPAVLLWGLGNEMEGPDGKNAAIWMAINQLAVMTKQLDRNHPTMTTLAEIGGDKIKNLHELCPAIDIVGINSYAGGVSLAERYRKAGGVKPFIITEFGPPGMWESPKTSWNAPIEISSTAKAAYYRRTYEASLQAKSLCLGSYAFLWGTKQETTATWFGMLLPDGSRLEAADTMQMLWTGKAAANRCPQIAEFKLSGLDKLKPGAKIKAALKAIDPEGDQLHVKWTLRSEVENYSTGGDAEKAANEFASAIVSSDASHAEIVMPDSGGGYRLFVEVRDNHQGAAVANIPLYVDGPKRTIAVRKAVLPLTIHDEPGDKPRTYVPSGWMGNTKALKLDEACTDRPKSGKTCVQLDYSANDGWGGIVWQDPPGDWGDQAGGWDVRGAKRLTFWARGAQGGEVASFEFGLYRSNKPFPDTATARLGDVRLGADWRQYQIELGGKELSRIKSGFAVIVSGQGKPVTIYLDAIRFE